MFPRGLQCSKVNKTDIERTKLEGILDVDDLLAVNQGDVESSLSEESDTVISPSSVTAADRHGAPVGSFGWRREEDRHPGRGIARVR